MTEKDRFNYICIYTSFILSEERFAMIQKIE